MLTWTLQFFNISLSHTAQNSSEEFRVIVQQFHCYLRRTASLEVKKRTDKETGLLGPWELSDIANMDQTSGLLGPWELSDIANMDQTSLEFCFNTKGATCADTGEKTMWCRKTDKIRGSAQCS